MPPFQVPDEGHHLYRAYHIAEGNWVGEKTNDARFGGELPSNLIDLERSFRYLRYDYDAKVDWNTLVAASMIPLQPEKTQFADFPNVAYYVPIPYFAQSHCLKVGIWLELPPLFLLYLARMAGFIFWVTMIYLAIRIIPFHKNTFAAIALLPSSLFINSGMTADSFTYGVCYLIFSVVLRLVFLFRNEKSTSSPYPLQRGTATVNHLIGAKDWMLLLVTTVSVTLSKVIYAPLLLLTFLIPKERFGKTFSKNKFIGSLLIINALALIVLYTSLKDSFISYDNYNPDYRTDVQLNEGVIPDAQLEFIFNHPIEFASIALKSHLDYAPSSIVHCIGKFGWEKNYLPFWVIGLLLLAITISAAFERNFSFQLSKKTRFTFLFTAATIIAAFTVVIYMQWSPVGNEEILSLGGRYYLPILPLIFFASKTTIFQISQKYLIGTLRALIFVGLFVGMLSLIVRYYEII